MPRTLCVGVLCFRAFVLHKLFVFRKAVLTISTKEQLINEEINEKEVRVIGRDNEQLGIMSSAEALEIAEKEDLDLVLIAPQAKPPVCRIMDYGKYRFEQSKRDKEARKNQKQAEIKEIQMSLNIDTNDFNTKLNHAVKFLNNGDKVRIKIRFRRARELSHMNLCEDLMRRFLDAVAEYGSADKPAKLEGKNYMTVVSPKAAPAGKKAKKASETTSEKQNKED